MKSPMSMWRKSAIAGSAVLLSVAMAMAAEIPTGVISVARHANVDGVDAALGANVYAGDALLTADDGTLRMRVGSGQLFMLASTDATMTQDHGRIDLLMRRGTAGFSATADDPLQIDTPIGTVRPADSNRSYGQVALIGANQIVISSYEGKLTLTKNGETRTIEAGKSYRVSLASAHASGAAAAAPQGQQGSGTNGNGQWIFDTVVLGSAALGGYAAYVILTESPSTPAPPTNLSASNR
jgi:hypothetical protein